MKIDIAVFMTAVQLQKKETKPERYLELIIWVTYQGHLI